MDTSIEDSEEESPKTVLKNFMATAAVKDTVRSSPRLAGTNDESETKSDTESNTSEEFLFMRGARNLTKGKYLKRPFNMAKVETAIALKENTPSNASKIKVATAKSHSPPVNLMRPSRRPAPARRQLKYSINQELFNAKVDNRVEEDSLTEGGEMQNVFPDDNSESSTSLSAKPVAGRRRLFGEKRIRKHLFNMKEFAAGVDAKIGDRLGINLDDTLSSPITSRRSLRPSSMLLNESGDDVSKEKLKEAILTPAVRPNETDLKTPTLSKTSAVRNSLIKPSSIKSTGKSPILTSYPTVVLEKLTDTFIARTLISENSDSNSIPTNRQAKKFAHSFISDSVSNNDHYYVSDRQGVILEVEAVSVVSDSTNDQSEDFIPGSGTLLQIYKSGSPPASVVVSSSSSSSTDGTAYLADISPASSTVLQNSNIGGKPRLPAKKLSKQSDATKIASPRHNVSQQNQFSVFKKGLRSDSNRTSPINRSEHISGQERGSLPSIVSKEISPSKNVSKKFHNFEPSGQLGENSPGNRTPIVTPRKYMTRSGSRSDRSNSGQKKLTDSARTNILTPRKSSENEEFGDKFERMIQNGNRADKRDDGSNIDGRKVSETMSENLATRNSQSITRPQDFIDEIQFITDTPTKTILTPRSTRKSTNQDASVTKLRENSASVTSKETDEKSLNQTRKNKTSVRKSPRSAINKKRITTADNSNISNQNLVPVNSFAEEKQVSRFRNFFRDEDASRKRKSSSSTGGSPPKKLSKTSILGSFDNRSLSTSSTKKSSRSQGKKPSKSPIKKLSKTPLKKLSKSPIKKLSKSPIKKLSKSPIKKLSKSPVKKSSRSPVKTPTRSPVKKSSRSPVKTPTRSPVKKPLKSPVKKPSKSPVKKPSKAVKKVAISPSKKLSTSSVKLSAGSLIFSSRKGKSQNVSLKSPVSPIKSPRFNMNKTSSFINQKSKRGAIPKQFPKRTTKRKIRASNNVATRSCVKFNVEHFTMRRLLPDTITAFHEESEEFMEQAIREICAANSKNGSKMITEREIVKYFISIGLFDNKNSWIQWVREKAPLQYRARLIPCARAGNIVY